MHNRTYVRSLLINSHMHFDFRGWFESRVSLDHISFSVYFTDKVRCHETFGYTCRCAKEFIVIQFYRDVSIICSYHVTVGNSSSDVTDLFFDFVFVLHFFSSLESCQNFCFVLFLNLFYHTIPH